MFGIGGFELFIILVFGFLIFGPDKLPDMARTAGRAIAKFRAAQKEMNEVIGDEKIVDLDNAEEPFKNPVEVLDRVAKRQEERRAAKGGEGSKASAAGTAKAPAASAKPDAASGAAGSAKGASGAEQQGDAPDGPASNGEPAEVPATESFTQRKARYERERAARKKAEAEGGAPQTAASNAGSRQAEPAADSPTPASKAEGEASDAPAQGGDA